MKDLNMLIEKEDKLIIAAVRGQASMLREGLEHYRKNGEMKKWVDFSPIMQESNSINFHYFLVGNIYTPDVCSMQVCQYTQHTPNTEIVCSGIGELTVDLIYDFMKSLKFQSHNLSQDFITEAIESQVGFKILYNELKDMSDYIHGDIIIKSILAEALQEQQEKYKNKKQA